MNAASPRPGWTQSAEGVWEKDDVVVWAAGPNRAKWWWWGRRGSNPAGQEHELGAAMDAATATFLTPIDVFLYDVRREMLAARGKYPSTELLTVALLAEAGELATALMQDPNQQVRIEAAQVAGIAARIAVEGDTTINQWRERRDLSLLKPIRINPSWLREMTEAESNGISVGGLAAEAQRVMAPDELERLRTERYNFDRWFCLSQQQSEAWEARALRAEQEARLLRGKLDAGDIPDDWMLHDGICHPVDDEGTVTVELAACRVRAFPPDEAMKEEVFPSALEAIDAALKIMGTSGKQEKPHWRKDGTSVRAWWRGMYLKVQQDKEGWDWSVRCIGHPPLARSGTPLASTAEEAQDAAESAARGALPE